MLTSYIKVAVKTYITAQKEPINLDNRLFQITSIAFTATLYKSIDTATKISST